MDQDQHFFDFAAEVGLTKHLGGLQTTKELVELCNISKDKYILDVGCGAGQTACYLAKEYGCRVFGIDILEKMVERSRERARNEKVLDKVEFRVADVQDLPFEDNLFDAVISESVTAFPEDKLRALNEYKRVTKPGGYVGLNESTWLKIPPPPEIVAWAEQDVGATVNPLTTIEWQELLMNAGLKEIRVRVSPINVQTETRGLTQRYGYGGMLGSMMRAFFLYLRNPAYRQFVKKVGQEGIKPENLEEYFGYGIYIGKK